MKKVATSQILLICGLVVLLVGCVMAYMKVEPLADYVLVVGALLIILRGSVRARERQDDNLHKNEEK